jgi:hypothetical protein
MASMLAQKSPRQAEQRSCSVATTCQPPSSWVKDPWPAVIRAIWPRGLSLSLARRFEKGCGLAVEVPANDGSSSTMLARVTHVQPHEDGYLLDVSFISELSEEEVEHVLSLSERGPGHVRMEVVAGVLFQARLADRSILRWLVRKLQVSDGWPLPEGKEMALSLPGAAPVTLTIKLCRTFGSYRVIDVQLPDDLPAEALALLTA